MAQPQRLLDGLDGVIGQIGDVGKGSVPDLSIGAKGFADGDGAVGLAVTVEVIGLDVHTGHYITHIISHCNRYYPHLQLFIQATF